MRRNKIIARSLLALIIAGATFGLIVARVHVQYPWVNGDVGHYHWLPVLWVLIVYGACFVALMAILLALIAGLTWVVVESKR